MKKVLSLVLVIAMVLSSMSFAFGATSFTDVAADSDYEDAINTLVALGVIKGYEDGTYKPEKVVTRAEMAKLIVEVLGYGNLVAGSKSNFSDTQGHWADAYIALAAGKGLVVGTGNGKFTPDRTVSYDEAITMIVRALGYTDTCNELKNMTWPTNFKVKAAELKLTDDVAISTSGADRGGVAQLLSNALTATLVSVNSDGDVVKATTQTTNTAGSVVVQYTELLSRLATFNDNYSVDADKLDKDSKNYAGNLVDLEPYMYQNLDVYLNDDDEVVFVKDTNSVVVEGTVSDILNKSDVSVDDSGVIAAGEDATVVVEDADEDTFDVAVNDKVTVYYNGEEETIQVEDLASTLYNNSAAKITAIVTDADKDGNVDNGEKAIAFVAAKATSAVQAKDNYVAGKTKIAGNKGNIALPVNSDGDVDADAITVTGAVDSLADIKADDVVVAYTAIHSSSDDSFALKLQVVRDTVQGKVTKTNSTAETIYIDGKAYYTSEIVNTIGAKAVDVAEEGTFYLDQNGDIFAADTDSAELTDYAIVENFGSGAVETVLQGESSVKTYAQLKLLTMKGETVTYKLLATFDGTTLDDYATLDGSASIYTNTTGLVLSTAITKGALIRYSVNEDGYIDEVETVASINEGVEKLDADEVDDIVTEDTVVFYFDGTDYSVVKTSAVEDGNATVVYYESGSNKGKIAVIYTTNAASDNDGTYGVIKSVSYTTNAAGDKVTEVTALVNGEEVKFLTKKVGSGSTPVNGIGQSDLGLKLARTTTNQAIKFSFNSSDVLTGLTLADTLDTNTPGTDTVAVYTGSITDITSTNMIIGGTTVRFATDCAVYIYDKSDDAITIGSLSDLDEGVALTTAYSTDAKNSSRINVVVQVQP